MSHVMAKLLKGPWALREQSRRFGQDETGSLALLALFFFMLMVMMGGVAVDLMRYESTRTALQQTLDRATLASASLSQTLGAEEVVTNYFDKAGLGEYLTGVQVAEGMNYREVIADARADTEPQFMHLIGIDNLEASGHSKAEQRMNNVEIVLVLDVSGSMGSNNRLINLKAAANEFVNNVLSSDDENRISISIVPFSENVNLPQILREKYNVSYLPVAAYRATNVNCLELPGSAFSQTGISRTTPIPMIPAADTTSNTDKSTSYVNMTDNKATNIQAEWSCRPKAQNMVVLPSNSISGLQAKIQGLTADSMTSINLGMKWGMAMLDPGTRSIYSEFVTSGTIPSAFEGRPFDYSDAEAMKVIILMTDGENTQGELVTDEYKAGTSPIFKSPYDGMYSIRFTTGRPGISGTREYWVPHRNEWRAKAWTNTSDLGNATPVLWEEVWKNNRMSWVVWQLYARAIGTNNSQRASQYTYWYNLMHSSTVPATMNNQLQTVCNLAKANGVTVYGIAFEAPLNGQTAISNCATSSAHYFNASGLQITSAFRAIANNISHLRLTQ